MSANLDAKKQLVEEIKQKISSAKSLAFVDYRGLTVEEDTKMRNEFRNNNAEYKVYKNRLVARALNELGIECEELEGTNAVAFGYEDEVSAPRIVCDFAKKTQKLAVKFGIIDGKVVDKAVIERYAMLPSKEVLVAQLMNVLNGPIRGVAVALKAISEKNN